MEYIKDHRRIAACLAESIVTGGSYLAAVSGGLDSVCMLHLLAGLREQCDFSLKAANFDHGIRKESKEELEFTANLAAELNIDFIGGQASAQAPKTNVEAWAREQRYKFLREVRESNSCDYILTAHNANDQAETLLLKLFSNREPRLIQRYCEKRRLLRPLLNVSRNALESYVHENSIQYLEDSSNNELVFERNRIRKVILPFIEQQLDRGDIVESLFLQGSRLQDLFFELDSDTESRLSEVNKLEFGSKTWLKETQGMLETLDSSAQRRLAEEIYFKQFNRRLGQKHGTLLASFLLSNSANLELPGSIKLIRKEGGLSVLQ